MREPVVLDRSLPPSAASTSHARRIVLEALELGEQERFIEEARVAVSEIVTNALVHAGTQVNVRVRVDGSGVRVEVADGSPHLPLRRAYSAVAGTGRGLHMVHKLVHDWGA